MSSHTEVTRILYVITKANWGGAQRYVYDLAIAAKAKGHEVLVVSGNEGVLIERLKEAGIATETIPAMQRDVRLQAEVRAFKALVAIVRRFNPHVLHANSSKAGLLGAVAGRLRHVPHIIFTAHGWAFNEKRPVWQKAVIALLHYATVLLSHTTICVSRAIRFDASRMPFVQKKFEVIHNGIAPVTLLPRDEARARLAPDLVHSFPTARWIGSIAELHPTKGLDTLIEAFAAISRNEPPVVLVLIGDGQDWAHLQKLVQIYDLPDRVVLAGFIENAPAYLSALDIFVLPSRSEALGYALLEAGLACLPSVGTRVGGIPEIITDNETGLLVPATDITALSTALTTLIEDPLLSKDLGSALNERVRADFSIEQMTEKTLALYTA